MHRREFVARLLAGASGAAIAATFDVEKFLWVPGAKRIFIPPVRPDTMLCAAAGHGGLGPPFPVYLPIEHEFVRVVGLDLPLRVQRG